MVSFLLTVSTIFLLALARHGAVADDSGPPPPTTPPPKPPTPKPDFTTFIDTSLDCANQYVWADTLATKTLNDTWKQVLEERRLNYTERVAECKQKLDTKKYAPAVADVLGYEMGVSGCPESISNTWKAVGIIFIIAFVLTLIALVAVSGMFYRNVKQGGLP